MFVAIVIGFVCIHRAGRRFYDLSPIPNLSAIPLRSESYHNTGDHFPWILADNCNKTVQGYLCKLHFGGNHGYRRCIHWYLIKKKGKKCKT